jgi:ubiquinone/menaquinone biosynthesis C-methylase UbiE
MSKIIIKDYWNKESCGTDIAKQHEKYSRAYFDQIEDYRYDHEAYIFEFAQFSRFYGKKILEVGVGAGTDFINFCRSGSEAYGIDLTEEAINNVKHRLKVYSLTCKELKVADAENLPYKDNYFDLVYSWGVIHHTENTIKALEEIIRVLKLGGIGKIMIYNRYALDSLSLYIKYGIMKLRPFRSLDFIYSKYQESPGTKVFSISEIRKILSNYPIKIIRTSAEVGNDELYGRGDQKFFTNIYRIFFRIITFFLGRKNVGTNLRIEFKKIS